MKSFQTSSIKPPLKPPLRSSLKPPLRSSLKSALKPPLKSPLKSPLTSARGQLVVLLLLLLPVFLAALLALADVAVLVVTKARLQVAADSAALAAGGVLTDTMNQLARFNWEIHHEFTQQQLEFTASQQQNKKAGETKLRQRQLVIDQRRSEMSSLVGTGYAKACRAALEVVNEEAPWAEMIPLYGGAYLVHNGEETDCVADSPLFSFYGDQVEQDQWEDLEFTYPYKGIAWYDPARVGDGEDELLSHRIKEAGQDQQVAFAVRLRAPLPRGLFRGLFTDTLTDTSQDGAWLAYPLAASAGVQPVGGSIEEVGLLEGDDLAAVEERAEAEGLFYDETLVPLDRLQQRSLGYQGLRYFDSTQGWVEDEDWYAQ